MLVSSTLKIAGNGKEEVDLVWFIQRFKSSLRSWQFFHKQMDQRKACSAFLSNEFLHDRDPQSWLDASLQPGAPLGWKMIVTQ